MMPMEAILKKYLPEESGFQKTVIQTMNYSMLAGGKRIRPMLMQETYRLFGGEGEEIEPFMAAIEMIHTYSLVHDDLPAMDNDLLRRGKPTTWAVYGEDMGILAGDALLTYAFETAAKAFSLSEHPVQVGKCLAVLAGKSGIYGMVGGQAVDVELTGTSIPREKLDFIYALKTGALVEASMMIGAILGSAEEEHLRVIRQIAGNIGLAFQIRDDILDVTGTAEELGKPIGSDARNEKTTYVTLEGMEKAHAKVKQLSEQAVQAFALLPGDAEFFMSFIKKLEERSK